MKLQLFSGSLICLLLIGACQQPAENTSASTAAQTTQTDNGTPQSPAAGVETETLRPGVVYSQVDRLNIRESAGTTSPVIIQAVEGEALTFTGEQTAFTEKIELRGVAYDKPWVQVKTKNGKIGWVYGAAVGPNKPSPSSKNTIDFPHFGRYDLDTWTKKNRIKGGGGDAETTEDTYTSNDQTLVITKTEMGEYGYSNTYKLLGPGNQLLRMRELSWSTGEDEKFHLEEMVYDLTTNPAKSYSRTEIFQQHYFQLKSKPETAKGAFVEAVLNEQQRRQISSF